LKTIDKDIFGDTFIEDDKGGRTTIKKDIFGDIVIEKESAGTAHNVHAEYSVKIGKEELASNEPSIHQVGQSSYRDLLIYCFK